MTASIWIDVEDIVEYFRFQPHPGGVQRVALALARALGERWPGPVRLARHAGDRASFAEASWDELDRMLSTAPPPAPREHRRDADQVRRGRLQRAILLLPPELRDPLFRAGVLQSQVLRNARLLVSRQHGRTQHGRVLREAPARAAPGGGGPLPGDLYLQLGAPWTVQGSAAVLSAMRAAGVRTGLLIHDLAPLRRPEWQPAQARERFRAWLEASLPAADHLLALSRFTEAEVRDFGRSRGLPIDRSVVLPAGAVAPEAGGVRAPGLPVPGTYALYVATLDARKNHALAVAVWHKLMAEVRAGSRAAESVPQLVFAGRIGSGVADLLQQLDNCQWLGGRVRLIGEPSDPELRTLYDGCRFTLMPSLYEGYGLPVGESLTLGKPCLAASGTALPEAGGAWCRYFDPDDAKDAHRVIAAVLDDPAALATWQADIAAGFRPRGWAEAADAVLALAERSPA